MAYFDKDYITFFKNLEKNNHKEWFHENKKTYEAKVKQPFAEFLGELIAAYSSLGKEIHMTPKEAVMRINRDIRFSADKTPYKIHMGAMVSPYGKKDHTHPAMYLEVSHKHVRFYSGSHGLEKQELYNLRQHIAYNLKEFDKLINAKPFKDTFGEIRGDKNKVLPAEFKEAAEKQPLIFNKNFYYFANYAAETMLEDNLVKKIITDFKKAIPLNNFIEEGIEG